MQSRELQKNIRKNERVSFACMLLCGILMVLLAMLPKVPGSITKLFRPIYIAVALFSISSSGMYGLGSTKLHVVNLLYYTVILLLHPMTSNAIVTYISMALFIVFFILAANRKWTRREITILIFAVLIACDLQAAIILYSNPSLLGDSGNQHVSFLGTIVNRNPIAFSITPGALCGMLLLLYDKRHKSAVRKGFYIVSCLTCSFAVFALGCRSAFAATAIGLFCIIWQKTREGKNSQERFGRKFIAIAVILSTILVAMYLAHGTYSARLFELGEDMDDSGRTEIWEQAFELIREKPVFGGGYDYWANSDSTMGTHNTFVLTMLYSGWTGGIMLGLFMLAMLVEMLRTKNIIPIGFLVETLLHSWTETSLDYYGYIPMILAVILLRYIQHRNRDLGTMLI